MNIFKKKLNPTITIDDTKLPSKYWMPDGKKIARALIEGKEVDGVTADWHTKAEIRKGKGRIMSLS